MTSNRRPARAAFTLVETVLALTLAVLVVGSVAGLLWWATLSVQRSESRLDPRERANLAFAALREPLRDAWSCRMSSDATRLAFSTPRGDGELWFDDVSRKLFLRRPGEAEARAIVSSGILGFRLLPVHPGLLRVAMDVARPADGPLASLGSLLVSDDVLVWAGCPDPDDVPWNPTPADPSRPAEGGEAR